MKITFVSTKVQHTSSVIVSTSCPKILFELEGFVPHFRDEREGERIKTAVDDISLSCQIEPLEIRNLS